MVGLDAGSGESNCCSNLLGRIWIFVKRRSKVLPGGTPGDWGRVARKFVQIRQLLRLPASGSSRIKGDSGGEPRPWPGPLGVPLLDAINHKAGVSNEHRYVTGEMASISEATLQWFESALPSHHIRIGGKTMLKKVELSARAHHPPQLAEH